MQLIKRLQCLAFAAVALAFAQLPALADPDALPQRGPIEGESARYSVDGGSSWSDWPAKPNWKSDVIDKINGTSASNLGGGTSDKQLVVIVKNAVIDAVTICSGHDFGSWGGAWIDTKNDYFRYTTICFSNCTISASNLVGFGASVGEGNLLRFENCQLLGLSCCWGMNYMPADANCHNVDVELINCYVESSTGGGCWNGDVTVANCTMNGEVNFNCGIYQFTDSRGGEAVLTVTNCEWTYANQYNQRCVYGNRYPKYYLYDSADDGYVYAANGNPGDYKDTPEGYVASSICNDAVKTFTYVANSATKDGVQLGAFNFLIMWQSLG